MGSPTAQPLDKPAVRRLLAQIEKIRHFELTGVSRLPGNEWELKGSGDVSIQREDNEISMREEGECYYSHSPSMIRFHNIWVLQLLGTQKLHIGHARNGFPSHLADLLHCREGHWEGAQPHQCGEDRYRVDLHLPDPSRIKMEWTASGPAKNYTLTRIFFTESPA